jgi:hypothetical protein
LCSRKGSGNVRVKVSSMFILSILLFFVGISMFLLLYIKGDSLLPHDAVFVPKGDVKIDEYTKITPQNFQQLFEIKEILAAAVNPNMITPDNMKEVLNKTMVLPLYPKDYLTLNHVRDSNLVPNKDELEYPIPPTWLEVTDFTVRAGDSTEIWLTPSEKLKNFYNQKSQAQGIGANLIVVPDLPERPLSTPLFIGLRLRYVVDGANRTVKNTKEGDDRAEATGKPAEVKINMTSKQFAQLKGAVEEGYKVLIVSKGL